MNAAVPSLLSVLQGHANERGDLLAHVLPDRDITYRRLWSRTERASARLQGEWGVQAGDTVAYIGGGHPDAIVLYFSLLRIGASVLPLEAMLASPPRVIFTAGNPAGNEDRLLAHPALASLKTTRRAALSPALLWCGGPTIVRAAERLGAVRRSL